MLFAIIFSFIPLLMIFKLSFQNGSILDTSTLQWIGFDNFKEIFNNEVYLRSMGNNFFYIVLAVPAGQIIAISLALLIKRKGKTNAFFESVYFLPLLISMVSASVMISYILSMQGPLNYVLSIFHISPLNWFGKPIMAKLAVVILELWKGATFYIFIYLAALRSIPTDYTDAARIDGANKWQETWKITLPLIKNAILLSVVVTTIFQFQIFESIYMLTGGGPLRTSEGIVFSIYKATFVQDEVGVGAALSVLFLFIILIVSLIQMRMLRSDNEY
jgi:multiple sugar transport system permease protein